MGDRECPPCAGDAGAEPGVVTGLPLGIKVTLEARDARLLDPLLALQRFQAFLLGLQIRRDACGGSGEGLHIALVTVLDVCRDCRVHVYISSAARCSCV
jgi:hypothetical protein